MTLTAAPHPALAQSALVFALEQVRLPMPDGWRPIELYPYQAALLADRSQRRLVLKARQVGITTGIAVEMAHEAIHRSRSLMLVVSREQGAAQDVIAKVMGVFDGLDAPPGLVRDSLSEIELENGSRIVSQPATAKAGRGFTATSVYMDEAAFMEYDARIYRAVSPTLARGGRLTVISTPDGQANLFYRLWQGMEGGDWSRHRIHWRDCPVFGEEWYERERPKYSAAQWSGEFECDFVGSDLGAFDPDDVDRMRVGWTGLQQPQPGRVYVNGWDIGRRRDATVGITVDVTELPYQVTAYTRMERAPYVQIMASVDDVAGQYGGATWVESNSIGDPVIEGLSCRALPFVTTAKSKADMLQRLVRGVEQDEVKCGVEQVLGELKSYQWDDRGLTQDSVIALAIALHAVGDAGTLADMNEWDLSSGHVPAVGLVDLSDSVLSVDTDVDFATVALVVLTRHWRRPEDLVVRHVQRWERPVPEELQESLVCVARDHRAVAIVYPTSVGIEELVKAVQLRAGIFAFAVEPADRPDYDLTLRRLVRERRILHPGDTALRESLAAARLRPGPEIAMASAGDTTRLARALSSGVGWAMYLNLSARVKEPA